MFLTLVGAPRTTTGSSHVRRSGSNRRFSAVVAVTGLWAVTAAVPVGAGEIVAHDDGDTVPAYRYAGDDRYETATLIATDDSATGASHDTDTVLLTRGDDFPDGLAGSYLSGVYDAPVLLTGTDSLPATTEQALEDLAPTKVILLGGPIAISEDVEASLEADGYGVARVEGPDRYGTAAAIAARGADGADVETAIVALGTNFPDALVAGPLSAEGGLPLLLTAHGELPDVTADALTDLGVSNVLLAGGPVAVAPEVEAEIEALDITVDRVDGPDRYGTATEFADWAVANLGFTTSHVNLATGQKFPDALTLGAHAAADYAGPSPVLLTSTTELSTATEDWLMAHADADNTAIHVGGGTVAIEHDVVEAARAAFTPGGWTTPARFAASMDVDDARAHLQAFQDIATANGGHREASSPGYDASIDYVKGLLDEAGYVTEVQEFDFDYFEETADPTFSQVDGEDGPQDFTWADTPDATDADFATMSYSGTGTVVDAPITAVDLSIAGDEADSTSGCEEADFAGFPAGDVALVQRGACAFATKAQNAFANDASGVIIFNQGNGGDDRTDVFFGTLGGPIDVDGTPGPDGPVISASYDVGVALANDDAAGTEASVSIDVEALNEVRSSANLLAETPGGDPNNVVMAGAHLDSVEEGPGINDNGTGTAALLEIALELAEQDAPVNNKLRFAWWGAEESGLVGSDEYVFSELIEPDFSDLTPAGKAVALYLNFDMVGSPNFARFIYDGDADTFGVGDEASGVIEHGFEDYFAAAGLATEPTEFSGRSDYAAFQIAEIPSGGLFTGAEGIKTAAQVDLYGGVAGEAYDRCYHAACDTMSNVNFVVFEQMLRAIAHEIYSYALSTAEVDAASGRTTARAPAAAPAAGGPQHAYAGDHLVR